MATSNTTPLTSAAARTDRPGPSNGFKAFWSRFFSTAFHPYRPELHYLRGPGPAWRAKHGMDAPFRLKPRDF
jgi:hypothetical protein